MSNNTINCLACGPCLTLCSKARFIYFSNVLIVDRMKSALDTVCNIPHISMPANGTTITAMNLLAPRRKHRKDNTNSNSNCNRNKNNTNNMTETERKEKKKNACVNFKCSASENVKHLENYLVILLYRSHWFRADCNQPTAVVSSNLKYCPHSSALSISSTAPKRIRNEEKEEWKFMTW